MTKINIGNKGFTYPMPMTLVGTHVDKKPNFMAVGWVTRVNYQPPIIAIAINMNHFTNKGIIESKAFSVNIPNVEMIEETDYLGLVSGKKVDKSDFFDLFYGELNTPMIKKCPLNIECSLREVVNLPTNQIFLGDIVAVYSEEKYLTDEKPDIKKLNPFTLTMPDNNFWSVGRHLGKAWEIGKKMKERS